VLATQVDLRDNAGTGTLVRARLVADFPADRLAEVEASWAPWRTRGPAEHTHWDWRNKTDPAALRWLRLFALEHEGVQGLMAVVKEPVPSRLATDAQAVYVSIVETAPWNLMPFTDAPRFSGCGKQLLYAAVAVSAELGLRGRIGLHALPQAEAFYAHCGMTRVRVDVEYGGLVYYELVPEQVEQLRVRCGA